MTKHRVVTLLAAAALGLVAPGGASGQGRPGAEEAKPAAPKRAGPDRQKGKKVLKLGDLEVEGRVDRPTVKGITPPKAVPSWRERADSFLPKVVEAVEKEPF
jgi:hypothetical protein